MEAGAILVFLGLVLVLLFLGWPVFVWTATAAAAAAWLRAVARRHEERSILWARIARCASDTAYCVTAGLGLVLVSQVLLRLFSKFVSERAVSTGEAFLIGSRDVLSSLTSLGFAATFGVVLVCLLVAHGRPSWTPVQRLAKYKKGLSYGWLSLVASTAFTFFAGARVSDAESRWVEANRDEYIAALRDIDHQAGRLVALAAIEEKAEEITPDERRALAETLGKASAASPRDDRIRAFSKQMAREFPRLQQTPGDARRLPERPTLRDQAAAKALRIQSVEVHPARLSSKRHEELRQWSTRSSSGGARSGASGRAAADGEKPPPPPPPPRKKELEHLRAEVAHYEQLADERLEAVTQVVTAAVESAMPRASHDLVRGLLDNLVGELVSGVIAECGVQEALTGLIRSHEQRISGRRATIAWKWPAQKEVVASSSPIHQGSTNARAPTPSQEPRPVRAGTKSSGSSSTNKPTSGRSSGGGLGGLPGIDFSKVKLGEVKPIEFKPSGYNPWDIKPGSMPGSFKPGGLNLRQPSGLGRPLPRTSLNEVRRQMGPRPGQPYRPPGYRPGPYRPIRRGPRR